MLAPEPVNAETDVQQRDRQLKARIKNFPDDLSARDAAAENLLPSFASSKRKTRLSWPMQNRVLRSTSC